MAAGREEAAPTFSAWKARLEATAPEDLEREIGRFVQVLEAVGTPMVDGPEAYFIYYGPGAGQVMLVGEFNQWGRGSDSIAMTPLLQTGVFYHMLELSEPARLEYKFVVDGEWITDPFCPNKVDNGVGGTNSYFVVGDLHEPSELRVRPDIQHGRVEDYEFHSERLDNTRHVYVYLPPAYDQEPAVRFPAFYVHDGGEYLERAHLGIVMDNLIHDGLVPAIIMVMIDPVNRITEYWANSQYVEFLCDEFIPSIDRRYRTIAERSARGVMGASLGGLISVYAALQRPRMFSRVAGQSSALHIEEQQLISLLGAVKGHRISFYLDVGKYEPRFIPANRGFAEHVKARRWPCLYQQLPGGHNWTSWRAHLKELLLFLWASSPTKRPRRRHRSNAR